MNTTIILFIIYHTIGIYAILNVKKMNIFYRIFEQKGEKRGKMTDRKKVK